MRAVRMGPGLQALRGRRGSTPPWRVVLPESARHAVPAPYREIERGREADLNEGISKTPAMGRREKKGSRLRLAQATEGQY